MRRCRFFAFIIAALILAAPAMADEYTFSKSPGQERFALALPANWSLLDTLPTEMFFDYRGNKGADDDLGARAGLDHDDMSLADQRVREYVDPGSHDLTVTNDRMLQQAGFPARRIDGTTVSEGDKLNFSSIAIKPAADAAIMTLTIWGSHNLWQRPDIKSQVESMLASFKPVP